MLLVNNLECIEIPYEEFEFFSQIVLESIKSGKGTFEIPEIEQFTNKVLLLVNNLECIEIPYEEFEFFSQIVLESIKSGKGTFEIPEIEPLLQKIKITKIKASNDSKKDIIFKIHDDFTGAEPIIGFSIKSYIGNKPTLLNASGATKVQYKLSRPLSTYEVEFLHNINTRIKIKDRVEYIKDKGVLLDFDSMINETFNRNLQMVDYRMPEILGNLFLESYFVEGKSISDVVDKYCDEFSEDKEIIIHKVKDLLVAVALGMEPNTKWTGLEDANGGYIVVKDDGEVLCYHIYDRNKLRNYLFRNTKFDSPSSS